MTKKSLQKYYLITEFILLKQKRKEILKLSSL